MPVTSELFPKFQVDGVRSRYADKLVDGLDDLVEDSLPLSKLKTVAKDLLGRFGNGTLNGQKGWILWLSGLEREYTSIPPSGRYPSGSNCCRFRLFDRNYRIFDPSFTLERKVQLVFDARAPNLSIRQKGTDLKWSKDTGYYGFKFSDRVVKDAIDRSLAVIIVETTDNGSFHLAKEYYGCKVVEKPYRLKPYANQHLALVVYNGKIMQGVTLETAAPLIYCNDGNSKASKLEFFDKGPIVQGLDDVEADLVKRFCDGSFTGKRSVAPVCLHGGKLSNGHYPIVYFDGEVRRERLFVSKKVDRASVLFRGNTIICYGPDGSVVNHHFTDSMGHEIERIPDYATSFPHVRVVPVDLSKERTLIHYGGRAYVFEFGQFRAMANAQANGDQRLAIVSRYRNADDIQFSLIMAEGSAVHKEDISPSRVEVAKTFRGFLDITGSWNDMQRRIIKPANYTKASVLELANEVNSGVQFVSELSDHLPFGKSLGEPIGDILGGFMYYHEKQREAFLQGDCEPGSESEINQIRARNEIYNLAMRAYIMHSLIDPLDSECYLRKSLTGRSYRIYSSGIERGLYPDEDVCVGRIYLGTQAQPEMTFDFYDPIQLGRWILKRQGKDTTREGVGVVRERLSRSVGLCGELKRKLKNLPGLLAGRNRLQLRALDEGHVLMKYNLGMGIANQVVDSIGTLHGSRDHRPDYSGLRWRGNTLMLEVALGNRQLADGLSEFYTNSGG